MRLTALVERSICRVVIVLTFVQLVAGQDATDLFSKAPPEIDNALRERVTGFYQLHVEGKFRQADEFIAEDSKDIYFESKKVRYRSFEIGRITYKDEFKQAVVALIVDSPALLVPGMPPNLKLPLVSNWKVVDGKWFWFVEQPPPGTFRTPFGYVPIPEGAKIDSGGGGAPPPANVTSPQAAASILSQVRVDRRDMQFVATKASSGQVKLTNGMPGAIKIRLGLENGFPGLHAELDKTDLNSQESAILTVQYEPANLTTVQREVIARIHVEPTGQAFPIRITFTNQP
jgi:hypothetical protein